MRTNPRVVVVGHVTHDRYGDEIVAGGSALYGARTHHALAAEVQLVSTVGTDFACERALGPIGRTIHCAGATTTFTNVYAPGRARVQRLGAQAPAVDPSTCPPAWRDCDLLHLAPVIGEVDLAAWLAGTRARFVGIGVQGWIKSAAGDAVVQRPWTITPAGLAGVHAACVGEEDLHDQGDLLDRLVAGVPVVAFTHGRNGCEVICAGQSTRIGVYPVDEIDPTGAGDVFAAAFFLRLAQGASAVDAARLGAAAASIAVEARDATSLGRLPEAWRRADEIHLVSR